MADILLPELPEDEEYVIRKKPKTHLQLLRDERDRLQAELDLMKEPSNEELKEMGKMMHPWYKKDEVLKYIKEEIKKLVG